MTRASAVCGAVALLLTCLAFAQALPDRKITFDLAAQPLGEALNEFAAQSNLRIVFNTEDAQGMVSTRLTGHFTPRTALKLLLTNSRLRYQFVDDRTVEIRSAKQADTVSTGESVTRLQGTR